MGRLDGKVVVITGAAGGIGREAALLFSEEGAQVCVADVVGEAGEQTASECRDAFFFQVDVTDPKSVEEMYRATAERYGGVDVLYNNAGVVRYGTVVDSSVEDWDFQLDTNLKGTFLTCKYAIPEMRKRGGGAIVNTASVQAFASQKTVPAYAASKGGVVSLTTTIALDHADDNIRCNCIAPGTIRTPMVDQAADTFGPDDPEGAIAEWGRLHPLGRVGKPEEVANLVLFLASDEASFCTGGCYRVDGGLLSPLFNG